ncbi:DUF6009 family protein [Streptomyces sp. NPDC091209]|uniref:DUF6009 family protein n=1 Tax=Streptomyces sp. NPDC091209 TaxID=3365974 RepID=UPI0038066113
MSALIAEDGLVHEAGPVRPGGIGAPGCVRQGPDPLPARRGTPPRRRDARTAGRALPGPGAEPSRSSGAVRRRALWLLPHGRGTGPEGLCATGAPAGAVGPRTLAPGGKGCKGCEAGRSGGGPPSSAMREAGIALPL